MEEDNWIGFALLNPWVRLVDEATAFNKLNELNNMKKKKFEIGTCLSGMMCNNSLADNEVEDNEAVIPFWFLNMASYYRDLRLHGKHIIFNVQAMVNLGIPVWHFFFLGHVGPFCNLHEVVYIEDNKYPWIPPTTINFGISHTKKELGAEVWCLFMYDTCLLYTSDAADE